MHRTFAASLLLLLATSPGCITIAGGKLPPIQPAAPSAPGTLEETVGDFSFTLEGGKMITSNKAGRMLNDELLERWKKRGYIAEHANVPSSQFTGKADYNLTLSGSQYGESWIALQIVSGLTLFLIPHSVNSRFDIQYTLEDVKTGAKYSAGVEDSYKSGPSCSWCSPCRSRAKARRRRSTAWRTTSTSSCARRAHSIRSALARGERSSPFEEEPWPKIPWTC